MLAVVPVATNETIAVGGALAIAAWARSPEGRGPGGFEAGPCAAVTARRPARDSNAGGGAPDAPARTLETVRGGAARIAREAHNLEVGGSNPPPAPNEQVAVAPMCRGVEASRRGVAVAVVGEPGAGNHDATSGHRACPAPSPEREVE